MNGRHHRSLTRATLALMGISGDEAEAMIQASQAPDHLRDVLVHMPGEGYQDRIFDKELAAFLHFQLVGGRGYCWQDDASLSILDDLGDLGMRATRMTVLGTSVPMLRACKEQPGVVLCDFRFPSAAKACGCYAAMSEGRDSVLMGMALHFVQDCCVPHHAWGALRWGHQAWEDGAEALWLDHVGRLMVDPAAIPDTLGRAAAAEACDQASVEELCEANAEWARRWFKTPGHLDECTGDAALAVSIRAIASSMQAIQLMTKEET